MQRRRFGDGACEVVCEQGSKRRARVQRAHAEALRHELYGADRLGEPLM